MSDADLIPIGGIIFTEIDERLDYLAWEDMGIIRITILNKNPFENESKRLRMWKHR